MPLSAHSTGRKNAHSGHCPRIRPGQTEICPHHPAPDPAEIAGLAPGTEIIADYMLPAPLRDSGRTTPRQTHAGGGRGR
jgi:hypothetical protein